MSRLGVVVLVLSLLSVACGVAALPVTVPSPQPPLESPETAQEAPGTKFSGILTRTTPEAVLCVSASKSLNLRIAPSTMAAADPDGLMHGEKVVVIGTGGSWYHIAVSDGRRGWVNASYLEECE